MKCMAYAMERDSMKSCKKFIVLALLSLLDVVSVPDSTIFTTQPSTKNCTLSDSLNVNA